MALSPYYTGDNVPLKFKCYDGDSPDTPTAAEVSAWRRKPDVAVLSDATGAISDNEVSFTVPANATERDGQYTAFFVLTMSNGYIRTHAIDFEVIKNPQ